ncbi:putative short-chain dehydrogenase [Chaetomium sp. MPI-SDFR-AT-0129]|nr:putative short-chain dehydrogenase [Chaetomium sp. MPI-SDFR-AT-0129]
MGFLWSQLFVTLPYPTGSYTGQIIIITGGNAGLGKEAARHYARLGATKIILAVRSIDKGLSAKEDIETTTKCASGTIDVWQLDMASYASVKAFASRVTSDLDRVDIFHANAGVARMHYHRAEQDEESITVNVVSTFLLLALVLPKLKATAAAFQTRPTFAITSSGAHVHTQFPQQHAADGEIFTTVSSPENFKTNLRDQYPISKLFEIYAVRAISERAPADRFPVTINCFTPGLCYSELDRDGPTLTFKIMKFFLARSTEAGSRTLLDAGVKGVESHGTYIADCQIAEPSTVVTSEAGKTAQERVWGELVRKLEGIEPGCTKNFS